MRTADATNVSGVIIPKHRAVGVTPVVAKTATGAIEHVPIARVTNLSQTLDKLKDEGFWTFGTEYERHSMPQIGIPREKSPLSSVMKEKVSQVI